MQAYRAVHSAFKNFLIKIIQVSLKYDEIHTGGESYWGNCLEFYHNQNDKGILDATIINISILKLSVGANNELHSFRKIKICFRM